MNRTIRYLTTLLILPPLAACGSMPVAQENVVEANTQTTEIVPPQELLPKPHLPVDTFNILETLENVVGLKATGLPYDRRPDSFSGGDAENHIYHNGLIDLYKLSDGGVWRIKVHSGIANRCGRAFSDRKIVEHFLRTISPAAAEDSQVVDKLFASIKAKGMDEATVGQIRFTAGGGCLQFMTATAQEALPNQQ